MFQLAPTKLDTK